MIMTARPGNEFGDRGTSTISFLNAEKALNQECANLLDRDSPPRPVPRPQTGRRTGRGRLDYYRTVDRQICSVRVNMFH
jgi:hypothetical protein